MTKKDLYKYSGMVTKVADGDTCTCLVDLGMKVFKLTIIRLAGINTPELTSKDPAIKKRALAAKVYLTSLVQDKTIYFNSKSLDKYDRSIAEIFLKDATFSINSLMVK